MTGLPFHLGLLAGSGGGGGAPISRVGLIDFNPGLDQPPELDFSPLAEDFTYPYSTNISVSASNPPVPWVNPMLL